MNDQQFHELLAAKDAQIAALMAQVTGLTAAIERLADGFAARVPANSSSMTCGQLWEDYQQTFAGETWASSVRNLMKAPMAHFADRKVTDLRRGDWTHYRDNVRKKQLTRLGGFPAVGTRNLELVRLKAMLAWAVDQEKIVASPFAGIKPEKARPARETTIGDEALERLLAKSQPMLRAFVLVAIDSGMRKSEVLFLKWDQVEDSGRVRISWTVAKTKRSRSVRLSERALDALDDLPRNAFSPYIFVNDKTGQPWSDTHMWQLFRGAAVEAKVPAAEGDGNVHFHDARHTYVTRTIQNGTPMAVAMRAAGHVTLQQASRYINLDETDLDIMKASNDAAIAAGPRRAPQRQPRTVDPRKTKTTG
jgi:integrase